jgi:predicted TIM-barrel fold metal-dependent hydrolase
MESWGRIAPNPLARPLPEYLRERFYVDIAVRTPGALALAIEIYGLDHVLFATDFPFNDPATHVAYLRENFPARELDIIMNANKLPFPPSRLGSEPVAAS